MKKRFAIILALLAAVFLIGMSPRSTQQDVDLEAEIARLDATAIPVGGVILWWGTAGDIPENFEICDGKVPYTRGAKFNYKKPDMRERFAMGVLKEPTFKPWVDNTGGANSVTLDTEHTVIKVPQHDHSMASHEHPMSHEHSIGSHGHATDPHKHDIDDHSHEIDGHKHPLGGKFTAFKEGNGATKQILIKGGNPDESGENTDALETEGTDGSTSEEAPQAGDKPLTTEDASPDDTETADPPDTKRAGDTKGHAHKVKIEDTRPAFTEFIFIIRVR